MENQMKGTQNIMHLTGMVEVKFWACLLTVNAANNENVKMQKKLQLTMMHPIIHNSIGEGPITKRETLLVFAISTLED